MKIAVILFSLLMSGLAQSDDWGEIGYKITSLESGFEENTKVHKVVKAVHCKYFSKKKQSLKEQSLMGHLFKESADQAKLEKVNKDLIEAQTAYCSPSDNTNPESFPGVLQVKCHSSCRKEFPKDKGILDFNGSEKGLPCESLCNSYVDKFRDFSGAVVEAKKIMNKDKDESLQDCSAGVSSDERSSGKSDIEESTGSSSKHDNRANHQ